MLESRAALIRTPVALAPEKAEWLERLLQRIEGVQKVDGSKYIMLHAPRTALPRITRAAAGQRAPDHPPARRHRRQGRAARGLPRERVLGDAREPQGRGRDLDPRPAGREDARMSTTHARLHRLGIRRGPRPRAAARAPAHRRTAGVSTTPCARSPIRYAPRATSRCSSSRASTPAPRSIPSTCATAEFAARGRPAGRARTARRSIRRLPTSRRFHAAQLRAPLGVETVARRRLRARARGRSTPSGSTCPGGTAPLPSTAIMLAVPARIAGCRLRVLCTPSRADGTLRPGRALRRARLRRGARLQDRRRAGDRGAWPTAPQSVPRVDKIFGPGNSWVMAAKQLLCGGPGGPAADLPAGPSEVLVIADESRAAGVRRRGPARAGRARAGFAGRAGFDVAGPDPRSRGRDRARAAAPRRGPAALQSSLRHSRAILVPDLEAAIEVANAYAPEHLILAVTNPRSLLPAIRAAGSVFLGPWTPEALGDYCSGANHVLPTHGYARTASGLSVDDFMRQMTVQEASRVRARERSGRSPSGWRGSKDWTRTRIRLRCASAAHAGGRMSDILRARAARDPRAGPGRHAFARRLGAHTPARQRESVAGRGRRRADRAQPVLRRPAAGAGAGTRRALRRRSGRHCSSRAAATRRSTCWCGHSAAPARIASWSARRPSACTVSPPKSRAQASRRSRWPTDFRLDAEALIRRWTPAVKVVFLCSPNNPTGNALDAGRRRARAGRARRARDRRDRRGVCRVLAGPRLPRRPGAPSRPGDPADALQGAWPRQCPLRRRDRRTRADRAARANHAALRPARPHGRGGARCPRARNASRARARASEHSSTSASACARNARGLSTASCESGRARPTSCWSEFADAARALAARPRTRPAAAGLLAPAGPRRAACGSRSAAARRTTACWRRWSPA